MANPQFFKEKFFDLAQEGVIGDPNGELAFGYMRVSSKGQAAEGRGGLPRQIQNIHKVAQEKGYKIPWEMVLADDDTGFEFETRPQLSVLRKELKSPNRRSGVVVMEYLDRLSRDADWHQGFLLDEMKKFRVTPVFFKAFHSRIERTVMGAIGQDGMEFSLDRMHDALLDKARSGRVTSKVPAYGYEFVDSNGMPGSAARRDTHYGIVEDEAQVIRFIFTMTAYQGKTQRWLAHELNIQGVPPPKKMSVWNNMMIHRIIHNPVYKGEFICHQETVKKVWYTDETTFNSMGTSKKVRHIFPEDSWIRVPVPAIVNPELWEEANLVSDKNKTMGSRNAKEPYLLTGLIKCASCGYTYFGSRCRKAPGSEEFYHYYGCFSRNNHYEELEGGGCRQRRIHCKKLDDAVWSVIYRTLLEPTVLLGVLERQYKGEDNEQVISQIEYLKEQVRTKITEDQRLVKGYMAGAFDELEFAERRKLLKDAQSRLEENLNEISAQAMTPEVYAQKRGAIVDLCQRAKENGMAENADFDTRRRTIKTVVDKITLNVEEGWFELEGVINGRFSLSIVNLSTNIMVHNITFLRL